MWEEGWEDSFSMKLGLLLSLATVAGVVYLGIRQALKRALALSSGARLERVATTSHDAKGIEI